MVDATEARNANEKEFGDAYVPGVPRKYTVKAKNAQLNGAIGVDDNDMGGGAKFSLGLLVRQPVNLPSWPRSSGRFSAPGW